MCEFYARGKRLLDVAQLSWSYNIIVIINSCSIAPYPLHVHSPNIREVECSVCQKDGYTKQVIRGGKPRGILNANFKFLHAGDVEPMQMNWRLPGHEVGR